MSNFRKGLSFTALILLTIIPLHSQTQENTEGQQLYQQYAQIGQQLQQIQEQALADENIIAMTEALSTKIEAAMVKENPELQATLDKKKELIDKYEKAEQAGDETQLEEIKTNFQAVAQMILPIQREIMQKEEFQTEANKIQTAVRNKMEEINPQTPQLITRMNELIAKLQQMQEQNQQ